MISTPLGARIDNYESALLNASNIKRELNALDFYRLKHLKPAFKKHHQEESKKFERLLKKLEKLRVISNDFCINQGFQEFLDDKFSKRDYFSMDELRKTLSKIREAKL